MKSSLGMPMLRLPTLVLVLALASFAKPAEPQNFEVTQRRQGYTTVESLSRFHPGDEPAWASPSFDDSQRPLFETGKNWNRQGYAGLKGYGRFRLRLKPPGSLASRTTLPSGP